jgi:hypothetical protein
MLSRSILFTCIPLIFLTLVSCAPQREFVRFDNSQSYPYSNQGIEGSVLPYAGDGAIHPSYSGRTYPYGVVVDGPRHSPYLSPQYRVMDLPAPLAPCQRIINNTDAPIIVRDGNPYRNNRIVMQEFH